jgi:hypothetical protein
MDRVVSWCPIALAACMACSAHAANLVPNPEFDQGITGWTPRDGSIVAIEQVEGFPAAPSVRVRTVSTCCSIVYSACMPVEVSPVDLAFRLYGISGRATASVHMYSDSACQVETAFEYAGGGMGNGTWMTAGRNGIALPAGTRAVRVSFSTSWATFASEGDALFDHVELVQRGDALFADSFDAAAAGP